MALAYVTFRRDHIAATDESDLVVARGRDATAQPMAIYIDKEVITTAVQIKGKSTSKRTT